MDNSNYIKAYNKITEACNILLVTHDRPDADALSSMCTLMELLRIMRKNFTGYCLDQPPYQFNFLPQVEKITSNKNSYQFDDFDLIIALDCGALNRTNLSDEIKTRTKEQFVIEFDHHPKTEDYSDLEIRDFKKSSTTEVLYYLFKTNQIKINKNIATCILTGVLGDTGNFLYPSTSNQTMQIASEMLSFGAQLINAHKSTIKNKSLAGMKLWGLAMSNLEINKKYNFAFSVLTREDLISGEATDEEMEGIAGFLSNLYGVNGLMLLREEDNGLVRGSLRTSDSKVDISILARLLGGGGHRAASGFKINGRIKKTETGYEII
jgi:bifunctional oligoribonuclease and PAP phosphatase NrnA